MGHHSVAFTYEAYGYLIDGRLSLVIDVEEDLPTRGATGANDSAALDRADGEDAQMTLF